VYNSVPVIMFTATAKAENIKCLLNLGAAAVWTKPGLDTIADKEEIVRRYDSLIELVSSQLNPDYGALRLLHDHTSAAFDNKNIDFEKLRALLFKKLDFIKYRLQLFTPEEKLGLLPDEYRKADIIYLDSNSFLTGTGKVNYTELMSALTMLSVITAKSKLSFLMDKRYSENLLPKVVVHNAVIDELVKFAKISVLKQKFDWESGALTFTDLVLYRATLSEFLLKDLINKELVRTELYLRERRPRYKGDPTVKQPGSRLNKPKEDVVADGYILDEVSDIIVAHETKPFGFEDDVSLLVITCDGKLKKKLAKFKDEKLNNLVLKTNVDFCKDFAKLAI
jgi:CheY-like chemotaxis protein